MGFMSFNMVTVHPILKLLIFVSSFSSIIVRLDGVVQDDECRVTRCGRTQIRFPFHLTEADGQRKDQCVFPPGFQLSCSSSYGLLSLYLEFEYVVNTSLPGLYLSISVNAIVDYIDYSSRQLHFSLPESEYEPRYKFLSKNIRQHYYSHYRQNYNDNNYLSDSPFKPYTLTYHPPYDNRDILGYASYFTDHTFYNCSSTSEVTRYANYGLIIRRVTSMRGHGYQVYAVYSHWETVEARLASCTKMYNVSDVPLNGGGLTWSFPNCGHCEAKGQYCRFKSNSTIHTKCYPKAKGLSSHKLLLTGKVGVFFFLLLNLAALYYAAKSYKQKKRYQSKIETFLEDYKALKPSRYSYADIKKITGQFKVKLGEGGYGSVFKGQISDDVVVAVKILNDKVDAKGKGEDFINEVSTIGMIHHVNVVRLVGYCADGCIRALIYEYQPNSSLNKFVFSRENQNSEFLGWEKMQDIAVGIAKGIEYLHQGCAQQILHLDIKPHNILLDQNFNPKISDFGLAKLCAKGESMVSMTMARGTIGYIAPEVFSRNFGKVSAKSDIYSFGMLLLEMVGAKNYTSKGTENNSEVYFPEWIFHQLEKGREMGSPIEEEVDSSNIAKKLTIVGLWCINWHPADRPSMKHVIQMLQEEDCPAIPPNPFNSAKNASTFSNKLEVISELE